MTVLASANKPGQIESFSLYKRRHLCVVMSAQPNVTLVNDFQSNIVDFQKIISQKNVFSFSTFHTPKSQQYNGKEMNFK
jgi:hypothetical protein